MAPRALAALAVALALALPTTPAAAQDDAAGNRVVMRADRVHYDESSGIATASGSVEFAHEGRILQADTVTYDEPADLVTASGNVVIVEPTGEILFSDHAEMTGDLREGVIRGVRVLLAENARLAANGARRLGGRTTEMAKAVYSPCELCPETPGRAPLWQVKARRAVHDRLLRDIVYHDATLEVFGVPVFYTPYLRHPDPTVERRTGFLKPTYGSSSILGHQVRIPYHLVLGPNRDATVTPLITQNEGVVLLGEYRERTETGAYAFDGSATSADARDDFGVRTDGRDERWHLHGEGQWRHDDIWRYGFDLYRASDDSYLSRYGFDNSDTLTSDLYIEGFHGRSYASAFGYVFQGLRREDESDRIPVVAPLMDYRLATDPDENGSFFTVDANAMALSREEGVNSKRVSVQGGWERPLLTDGGHFFTLGTSLRGDAYVVDYVPVDGGRAEESGFVGRVVPRTSLEWRYPLSRTDGALQQMVEPIVQAVWSPNGLNPERIPNEDSRDFEFDEINLFSVNRFPGLDRVEGGARVNYGLSMTLLGFGGGPNEFLIGQTWRKRDDSTFGPRSGLGDHFSDYVGRLLIRPDEYVDMLYRFRIDHDDFSFRRSELGFGVGPDWARFDASYVRLEDAASDIVDTTGAREQVAMQGKLELMEEWTLRADWREDLSGGGTISYGGSLVYENECIVIAVRGERRFTDNVAIDPETVILFTVELKSLG